MSRAHLRVVEGPVAPDHPIVFFDGECMLCNGFVDWLLRVDRQAIIRVASLQGETARRLLPSQPEQPADWSMLYLDERKLHDQSDAALEVCRRLGGAWWILSLARAVPRRVRNPIYRVVARNRYRWFGKRETCRVPGDEERERFLP